MQTREHIQTCLHDSNSQLLVTFPTLNICAAQTANITAINAHKELRKKIPIQSTEKRQINKNNSRKLNKSAFKAFKVNSKKRFHQ